MEEKQRQEEEKTCKRCKQTFTQASNTSTSCRFHPSFFVCRRHDDQKRLCNLDIEKQQSDCQSPYCVIFAVGFEPLSATVIGLPGAVNSSESVFRDRHSW
ncbi:hypothetical protein Tsubulata_011999 [Turnera subulata]|uniref:Uncharacterized protein n=1 Tax=Turnera subulata TaxID=218843 RepID=A0A9Q0FDI2_9ROSI|nr:hypothetical protein Tsubulata_011999 [Turnera subulata]